jgi:hypothetical protein
MPLLLACRMYSRYEAMARRLKSTILWQNSDGAWKMTRVISYHHNHGLPSK